MTSSPEPASFPVDAALRERAARIFPGGMYGHMATRLQWPSAPQFFARAAGAHVWDVDGNEYVDLMCSWGPILLGHRHPHVEAAVRAQHELVDAGDGPSPVFVELGERIVTAVAHADWAMFGKNGSDATTLGLTIARAFTGRRTILVAEGAYHGALPWCTPVPVGTVDGDRLHLAYYTYNDLASVRALAEAHAGDLAGIIVSPFRHDAGWDQELPDPAFARGLRELCDRTGAQLILDDVRAGFRVHHGGSWEPLGVAPDLSAWSKGIANGYALSALLGAEHLRETATSVFATGSFWFSADAMAAAVATLEVLEAEDGVRWMNAWGEHFGRGLTGHADAHGVEITLTGPPAMPYVTFAGDVEHRLSDVFAAGCAHRGLFLHPRHNWFVCTAHSDDDLETALRAVDGALADVARTAAAVTTAV